jgi:hypothetical protein
MDTRSRHVEVTKPKASFEEGTTKRLALVVPARDFFVRQGSPTTAMPGRIAEEG